MVDRSLPIEKSALALVVSSLLLTGCGGGSGSSNAGSAVGVNTPASGESPGSSLPYTLCHDTDLDGSCTEESTSSKFTSQAEAMAAVVAEGFGPVIVVGDDGSLLTAASESSNANLWTTLAYNEVFFNPTVGADESLIATYLADKLNVSALGLTAADYAAFNNSLASARALFPDVRGYVVIAAVIDAAVIQGSLVNAVPSAEQVESQIALAGRLESELVPVEKATWKTSDSDERVRLIKASGNNILVINRWHNGVAIVDPNNQKQAVSSQPFAAIKGAGHNISSTDVDYISGASEHTLTDAWLSDTGDVLYALVPGPDSTVSGDDSFGLFRVPLINGALPENTVTVTSGDESVPHAVPHRHSSVTRVANGNVENVIALPDGRILGYDREAGYVRIYAEDLTEDVTSAFPLDSALVGWTLAEGGLSISLLLAELEDGAGATLQRRRLDTLASVATTTMIENTASALIGTQASGSLIVINDAQLFFYSATTLNLVGSLDLPAAPSSSVFALSADGRVLALSVDGSILLVSTGEAFPVKLGSFEYDGSLRALAINGDDLLYSDDGGVLKSVVISGVDFVPESVENLMANALAGVSEDSLNHGYALDAVIYPLDMPSRYGAVDLSWQVSEELDNTLVALGDDPYSLLVQPEVGEAPVTGSVSVTAGFSFRGDTQTSDTQFYNISVRPLSVDKTHNELTLGGDLAGRSLPLLSVNNDGSMAVVYAEATDEKAGGIALITYSGGDISAGKVIELPTALTEGIVRGLVWSGANLRVVVSADADGFAHILTLDTATSTWVADATLEGSVLNRSVGTSQDGSVMSIGINNPTLTEYQIRTYNVMDLTEIATIETDADSTGTRYPTVTVANSGDNVFGYIRNGSDRYLNRYSADTDGTPESTSELSGATYGFEYDNASDRLLMGNNSAELSIIAAAVNGGDYSTRLVFDTARGTYDGTDVSVRRGGRFYSVALNGNTVYLWAYARGLSAIDISDSANPIEQFWAPLADTRIGDISGNGGVLFTHAYNSDDARSVIAVIDLSTAAN